MSVDVTQIDVAAGAAVAAEEAARATGLRIVEVDDLADLERVVGLLNEVWNNSAEEPLISLSTLKALAHAGSYVSAAFRDGELIGALIGFLGLRDGELQMHSHVLGVAPGLQGRSIGFALKLHQRAWALTRGISRIAWTFDPLVSRNAYFNLTKLGATITAYYEDFYGRMSDGINAGDESDRVLVEWALAAPAVIELGLSHPLEPDLDVLRKQGAVVALTSDDGGAPIVGDSLRAATLIVEVPPDVVGLRDRDRAMALRWRRAVRATLGSALDSGYVATGMTRSGCYVLTHRAP